MSFRNGCRVVLVLLFFAAGLSAQESLPVPVFVTHLETPLPAPMKPEQHEAAFKRTRDEMFAVAAQLRKQHGDKTNQWPPEVWKIFNDAEDVHMMTVARHDYERPETQLALADSVEDFVRGAAANKGMTLVKSAEDASLVVQITGRRYAPGADVFEPKYFIRFRLSPGARMPTERFMDLTQGYKWTSVFSKAFARPKLGAIWVDLEAGTPASYKNSAGMVRAVVENFIRATIDPAKKKK
jgi:hypothetical protein